MRFDQFMRRECLVRVLIFGESHLQQILSTYAAMRSAHTLLWTKTRLWVERSSDRSHLSASQSCLDYPTITSGYNFRKAQVHLRPRRHRCSHHVGCLAKSHPPNFGGCNESNCPIQTETAGHRKKGDRFRPNAHRNAVFAAARTCAGRKQSPECLSENILNPLNHL